MRAVPRGPVSAIACLAVALGTVLLAPSSAQAAGGVRTEGVRCTIVGTQGNDVLRGTSKRDVICGRGGNDIVRGGGGGDRIDGGTGKDRIYGGAGRDRIAGGAGTDVLLGNAGPDLIKGGDGNDRIEGGAGNDQMLAGRGNDRVHGNSGTDSLVGNAGADRLDGGVGADKIAGESGDDVVDGRNGDDTLAGGPGNDVVIGLSGDDNLSGGQGTDRLDGGSGFNLCDVPDAGDQQLRCATDVEAPVAGALVSSPSVVDVSASSQRVRVSVRVTDDTGVKSVQIGPGFGSLTSGTTRNGVWTAVIEVPRFSQPGPRSHFVYVRDRVGRSSYEDRANVFTVVSSQVDQAMPVLTALTLSTTSVDVRSSPQPVTGTISVTDDLAGPKDVRMCLTEPDPETRRYDRYVVCTAMNQLSGGPQSSTWRGTVAVPQGAVSGSLNVQIEIGDAAEIRPADSWLGPEAWAAVVNYDVSGRRPIPGGAGAVTVLGSAIGTDSPPPALTSVTVSPSTVDTSRGAVRVTATMTGTDDEGITAARLNIGVQASMTGIGGYIDVANVTDFRLVSGTTRDGTWQATFVVPGGTPNGRYDIHAGFSDRRRSTEWSSPGASWGSDGTLDRTPLPSTTYFVVANSS
jgi:Ca2+-binding RTX toxin-like protein